MNEHPAELLVTGNAGNAEAQAYGGWFVGDFNEWTAGKGEIAIDVQQQFGIRNSKNVEVKWGIHPAGQERPGGWAGPSAAHTMSILISGEFMLRFRDGSDASIQEVRLERVGDYAVWSAQGKDHTWYSISDSVILSVRWKG